MPQITRTVNDVIVNAAYLIGEVGVDQTPDGVLISIGLDIVNEVLDECSGKGISIPFLTTINFDFVVGKSTYSVSDIVPFSDIHSDRIIDLSFANYTVPTTGQTNIVYPLKIISKAEYYTNVRQGNLIARPGFIFLNRQDIESFITVYPSPDRPYPCSIQTKSMLNSLSNMNSLGELPPFYYGFLKYAVGCRLSSYYPSSNWGVKEQTQHDEYWRMAKNDNETDLTVRQSSILSVPEPFYWPNILSY